MTDNSKINVYVAGLDEQVRRMWFEEGYNVILSSPEKADIVCFVGGFDIDPSLYGQVKNPRAHVMVSLQDDKRDLNVWNMTKTEVLKVGICRGGQFLHVMNGGRLYQHVSGHASKHKVYDTIWKKEFEVTSSHHQMMVPQEGRGEVLAYAEDVGRNYQGPYGDMEKPEFEPELLWYKETNSLCAQFHPEWTKRGSEEHSYFFDIIHGLRG